MDRVSEFYTSLIAACSKYVGMKSRYPQNGLIKSEAPSLEIEHQSGGTKTTKVAATTSGSASAQDSEIPKVGAEVKEEADVGQGQCQQHCTGLGRTVDESWTWAWPQLPWWHKWW
jgi:hypothetical protein